MQIPRVDNHGYIRYSTKSRFCISVDNLKY
uniref:Uncharacterized protein n=1 Tax=Anguilla anguilla TaxID=7936 RepID=A0A0E9UPW4_ANGAN